MECFFGLTEHGTTARREMAPGAATFLAMACIMIGNPQIMAAAGIDPGAPAPKGVNWADEKEYSSAMPFTFSIATGIGLGCLAHAGITTLAGLCAVKFAVG